MTAKTQRSRKAKGTRLEKWVMDQFNRLPGWKARKQPGSGIFQDFPHDVHAEHDTFGRFTIECKSWKAGWRTGDKAMGMADFLVIRRDYGEAMVYMSFSKFAEIVSHEPGSLDGDSPGLERESTRRFGWGR